MYSLEDEGWEAGRASGRAEVIHKIRKWAREEQADEDAGDDRDIVFDELHAFLDELERH